MKKWMWLLVVPYVVLPADVQNNCAPLAISYCGTHMEYIVVNGTYTVDNLMDKSIAEDIAFALNEAHERRTTGTWTHVEKIIPMPEVKASDCAPKLIYPCGQAL